MTITILKALLVTVILAVMIIVLITINHFFAGGFNSDTNGIDELCQDVLENEDVITDNSAFREFVKVKSPVRPDKER